MTSFVEYTKYLQTIERSKFDSMSILEIFETKNNFRESFYVTLRVIDTIPNAPPFRYFLHP